MARNKSPNGHLNILRCNLPNFCHPWNMNMFSLLHVFFSGSVETLVFWKAAVFTGAKKYLILCFQLWGILTFTSSDWDTHFKGIIIKEFCIEISLPNCKIYAAFTTHKKTTLHLALTIVRKGWNNQYYLYMETDKTSETLELPCTKMSSQPLHSYSLLLQVHLITPLILITGRHMHLVIFIIPDTRVFPAWQRRGKILPGTHTLLHPISSTSYGCLPTFY